MKQFAAWLFAAWLPLAAWASQPAAGPALSVDQIVEKNAAARGGLDAWRRIETMAWHGHIERGNGPGPRPSFMLEQKRPNMVRFQLVVDKQLSMRVYDGSKGWKVRPTASGRPELQPYTPEELSFAHDGPIIEGPLMDHAAKGIAVTLEGVDELEGRKAYRLNLRLPSGAVNRLWIDAETFLDLRLDRTAPGAKSQSGVVSMVYRDYQDFEGLQIPRVIETGAASGKSADRMTIDKVVLNSHLDNSQFARPRMPGSHRNGVLVDTTAAAHPQTGAQTNRAGVRPAP